jgi:hypothetical protein
LSPKKIKRYVNNYDRRRNFIEDGILLRYKHNELAGITILEASKR